MRQLSNDNYREKSRAKLGVLLIKGYYYGIHYYRAHRRRDKGRSCRNRKSRRRHHHDNARGICEQRNPESTVRGYFISVQHIPKGDTKGDKKSYVRYYVCRSDTGYEKVVYAKQQPYYNQAKAHNQHYTMLLVNTVFHYNTPKIKMLTYFSTNDLKNQYTKYEKNIKIRKNRLLADDSADPLQKRRSQCEKIKSQTLTHLILARITAIFHIDFKNAKKTKNFKKLLLFHFSYVIILLVNL